MLINHRNSWSRPLWLCFWLILLLTVAFTLSAAPSAETEATPSPEAAVTDAAGVIESCDFDLAGVQNLLDEAQAAFDAGQQSRATALLGDFNHQLEVIGFACDPIPEMIELSFGIGEVLAFEVPVKWHMSVPDEEPFNGDMVVILGSDSSISATRRTGHAGFTQRSGLEPQQKMIAIGWRSSFLISRRMGIDVEHHGPVTLDQAVAHLISVRDLDSALLTQAERVTIQGWTAQRLVWADDEAETIYYVIELDAGQGYVDVAATAAAGHSVPLDILTRAMLETLVFTPPFEP